MVILSSYHFTSFCYLKGISFLFILNCKVGGNIPYLQQTKRPFTYQCLKLVVAGSIFSNKNLNLLTAQNGSDMYLASQVTYYLKNMTVVFPK